MRRIEAEGEGVVIYLRQEGRGIGLVKKLQAYNLQDQGYDTVDANLALGHSADERDYTIAAAILRDLNINSVRLMTNNPHKIDSLTSLGIEIHERVELQTAIHADNERYLTVKAQRMNHFLRVEE
jgi:GTP cyclohydrolase II